VLGAVVLGDNVKVGGGSVVVKDVPAKRDLVGVPARIVAQDGKPVRRFRSSARRDADPNAVHHRATAASARTAGTAAFRARRQSSKKKPGAGDQLRSLICETLATRTRGARVVPLRPGSVRIYVTDDTLLAQAHRTRAILLSSTFCAATSSIAAIADLRSGVTDIDDAASTQPRPTA
jgi:hypothetical protein